jgi:hypothetical protein
VCKPLRGALCVWFEEMILSDQEKGAVPTQIDKLNNPDINRCTKEMGYIHQKK